MSLLPFIINKLTFLWLLIRLNLKGVGLVKLLFGLSDDLNETDGFIKENLNYVKGLNALLSSKGEYNDHETGPFQV